MNIRSILLLLSALVLTGSIGLYVYTKRLAPWRGAEGIVCTDSRCGTSVMNQKYNFWLTKAGAENNPDLCNKVEGYNYDFEVKASKEEAIAKCRAEVGAEASTPSECNRLGSADQQYSCMLSFLEKVEDANDCNILPSSTDLPSVRHLCYTNFAIETNDISLCERITEQGHDPKDSGSRLECVSALASINESPEMCSRLANPDSFDGCVVDVALDLGNVGYCDMASSSAARKSCSESFRERQEEPSPEE